MTRQAIQLGWLPRLQITQTSEERLRPDICRRHKLAAHDCHGSVVDVVLAASRTIWLPAYVSPVFRDHADRTSALLLIAMREVWGGAVVVKWAPIAGSAFLVVSMPAFPATSREVADARLVPIALWPACSYGVM